MTSSSTAASSSDKYEKAFDDGPLTQEEEAALTQIEQDSLQSASVASKKRRRRSASPHLTPSRLRSSVKVTERALNAGFKPNNTHSFRQESSAGAPNSTALSYASADADAAARRSESVRRSESAVPSSRHPSAPAADSRLGQAAGPGGFGYAGAMGGYPGAMGGYPGAMGGHPSGMSGHPSAMGGHHGAMSGYPGQYHHYPMPQQYAGYAGPPGQADSAHHRAPSGGGPPGANAASSAAADANVRRSESTGPPLHLGGIGQGEGSGEDSRRAQSTGPVAPMQSTMHSGGFGNSGVLGEQPGLYPSYPMHQQYGAYAGVSQQNPNSMPPAYFHPQQVYQNAPHFQDPKHDRPLPAEASPADVFSPRYPPPEPQHSPRISTLKPPSGRPLSSASMRSPTPARAPAVGSPTRTYSAASSRGVASASAAGPGPGAAGATGASASPTYSSASSRGPASAKASKPEPEEADATSALASTPPRGVSLQPATPQSSRSFGDEEEAASDDDGDRAALDDSPTIGRLSTVGRDALKKGFASLDQAVKRISADTGLTPAQIVERWDVGKTRTVSSWNIYQGYFEENSEQELARIAPEARPLPGAIPPKSVVSACYARFKETKPKGYESILRSFHRLRLMSDGGETSIARRSREFKKLTEKVESWIRQASSLYGFEVVCLAVGGVVNQDQNLASILCTDAADDFFLERFHTTDEGALGQMKAHIYDRLSKRMASALDDPPLAEEPTSVIAVKRETSAAPGADLKEKLIALAARHNITITMARGALCWKNLPELVAEKGYVIVNWPEDVPFPGDSSTGVNGSKGIAVLKLPERALLLAAFDHPTHPLRLERRYHGSGVPQDKPVIIGAPPAANSAHTHGRRKFLGLRRNEDRKGPARLPAAPLAQGGTTASQKPPSCASRKGSPPEDASKDDEEVEAERTPRASKKSASSKHSAQASKKIVVSKGKNKTQVQFVELDDDAGEDPDGTYCASQDEAPQYSGSDDEMPLGRSPLHLRSKASAKATKSEKKRAPSKPSSQKGRRPSSDEEEEAQPLVNAKSTAKKQAPSKSPAQKRRLPSSDEEEEEEKQNSPQVASITEVDDDSPERLPKMDKKRRIEMATHKPVAPARSTISSPKQPRAGERSSAARVAQMLFNDGLAGPGGSGGGRPPALPSHAAASAPPPAANPPPGSMPSGPTPPSGAPQGYYHPGQYSEQYGHHYVHGERPSGWHPTSGQAPPGWYGPGPANPPLPSTSNNAQTTDAGRTAGYWPPQGSSIHPGLHGLYPPPSVHPSNPPQDKAPRAYDDGAYTSIYPSLHGLYPPHSVHPPHLPQKAPRGSDDGAH